MPRCGCWLEMGDRSMVWISTIKSPNLAPGSFWLLSDTKNSAPSPSHKSKSKALPWTSEIGQVWVLLSLMGDLPLPIKKWPVMLKKIPLPLFKALVPSTGEWTRKVLPFLATTEVWEAKTNTNEGLFLILMAKYLFSHGVSQAEESWNPASLLTGGFCEELSSPHPLLVYRRTQHTLLTNLTSICPLINSLPMGKK